MKLNSNKGIIELPIKETTELCKIGLHRLDLSKEKPTCIACGNEI